MKKSIEASKKYNERLKKKKKVKIIPDPGLELDPITSDGMIKLNFNQEMIAPKYVDADKYSYVFKFSMRSGLDGKITEVKIVNPKIETNSSSSPNISRHLEF